MLEVVKQLRISRFMSSVFLSKNQRELVKFLKPYVLYAQKKKKGRRTVRLDSETTITPAEEALLDFKPDENEIDGKLYDGIVETDQGKAGARMTENTHDSGGDLQVHIEQIDKQPARHSRFINEQDLDLLRGGGKTASEQDESDTSSEDEDYEIGGMQGFNTNMDDYLENFGSVSLNPAESNLGMTRSRS